MRPLHKAFLSIAAIAILFAAFLLPRTQTVSVRADAAIRVPRDLCSHGRVGLGERVQDFQYARSEGRQGQREQPRRLRFGQRTTSCSSDRAPIGLGASMTAIVWPDVSILAARLGAEETMGAELERVHSFVESIPVPAVVPQVRLPMQSVQEPAGGGGIDFEGLANCEGSGINGWRTGLYGLETNTNDVGSWSIEAQQAKVREIYAAHGATAWGALCQRFFGG